MIRAVTIGTSAGYMSVHQLLLFSLYDFQETRVLSCVVLLLLVKMSTITACHFSQVNHKDQTQKTKLDILIAKTK
jgi:hypothetical protein